MERLITLLDELKSKLPQIDFLSGVDTLRDINACIRVVQEYISQLKQLKPAMFVEPNSEVAFYKEISPAFYSLLIYYVRLLTIAAKIIPSGDKAKKTISKEMRRIERYYEAQKKVRRYFLLNESSQDLQLFTLASSFSPMTIYEDACVADQDLCTPTGLIFARFMAYEKLHDLLHRHLISFKDSGRQQVSRATAFGVQWTDKKVHLQELIYALAYSHSINNGNIDVKALARVFETLFKVDLSNIYRAKQDMYTRKNASAYLDFLRKCFKDGIDEADDRNNYR